MERSVYVSGMCGFVCMVLALVLMSSTLNTIGVVDAATTACVLATFNFSLQRTIISSGSSGNGPYAYNATTQLTGTPSSSSIGNFSFLAYRFGVTDSPSFTQFNFTGNYTVTNINGVAGDSFYGNYTGSGAGSPAKLAIAGFVNGGTGKYASAFGAMALNGSQVGQITSPTTSAGNGTYTLVAAVVTP